MRIFESPFHVITSSVVEVVLEVTWKSHGHFLTNTMTTFLYDLSTTGAISFSDIINDSSNSFTRRLSEATQIRSRLRGALKESKRTDGEKDYLTIIKVRFKDLSCKLIEANVRKDHR